MRWVRLVMLGLMLAACAQPTSVTPTLLPTAATSSLTPHATATPSLTPSLAPSATPRPTVTRVPATPTRAPTATAATLPATFDLPDWLADPATPVLAALLADDYTGDRAVVFRNAAAGDAYTITLPVDVSTFVWQDARRFVFLPPGFAFAVALDLTTGQVERIPLAPSVSRRLPADYAGPLALVPDYVCDCWLLLPIDYRGLPANRRYAAEWLEVADGQVLSVIAEGTEITVWASPHLPDDWGGAFAWSPADENVLVYVHGRYDEYHDYLTEDLRLTVVNVASGAVLAEAIGDLGALAWSPDGAQLVYTDAQSRYSSLGFGFTAAPCLFNLAPRSTTCLSAIPAYAPTGWQLSNSALYRFTANGGALYFTYLYQAPEKMRGELCRYQLSDGTLICPTAGLAALDQRSLLNYRLSPDEQYAYLCYGKSSLLNDYADEAADGVLALTDAAEPISFFTWTSTILDGPPTCSRHVAWRPLP